MSGQVHRRKGDSQNRERFLIRHDLNHDKGNKLFVVQESGATFISRSHSVRCFRGGDKTHPPFLQEVTTSGMVVMGMRQNTIANIFGRQTPVAHIVKDLLEGIATTTIDHE